MPSCYVGGPMRGLKCFNFPLFNEVTRVLRLNDWKVISPAELDRDAKEPWTNPADPDWADDTWVVTKADCRRLVKRDVNVLLSLDPEGGDRVIFLPGWRKSTGAFGEGGLGRWLMVPLLEVNPTELASGNVTLVEVAEGNWGPKAAMVPLHDVTNVVKQGLTLLAGRAVGA